MREATATTRRTALWRLNPATLAAPPSCFHPSSWRSLALRVRRLTHCWVCNDLWPQSRGPVADTALGPRRARSVKNRANLQPQRVSLPGCPAGPALASTSASAPGSAKQHVCGSLGGACWGVNTSCAALGTWRGAELNRALRLLAGSPHGCTEAIMLAHGFTAELLANLAPDCAPSLGGLRRAPALPRRAGWGLRRRYSTCPGGG
jgi:hypothetical protein